MRRSIRRGPHSALLQQRSGGESQQFERIIREDMMAGFSIDHIGQLEVYLVLAVFTFAPIVMDSSFARCISE